MAYTKVEATILDRFRRRCLTAGGVSPGYGMRVQAIRYGAEEGGLDFQQGLSSLVEKGLLRANDKGDWMYLTALGAQEVEAGM